jgi:hypothetical protein
MSDQRTDREGGEVRQTEAGTKVYLVSVVVQLAAVMVFVAVYMLTLWLEVSYALLVGVIAAVVVAVATAFLLRNFVDRKKS